MKKLLFFVVLISAYTLDAGAQNPPNSDTLEIEGITIIRDQGADTLPQKERKGILKKLSSKTTPKKIKTEWAIFDIGFSSFSDDTRYADRDAQNYAPGANEEWMGLKPFKSRNVNIWVVSQEFNLISHYLNFRYGLGLELNNYYYLQPVRYEARTPAVENPPIVFLDKTFNRTYTKNKLAADYVTAPIMLNFNLTPHRLYPFEIGAGMSVGYLYSARNKAVNSDEGKIKNRGDFDLRPWKLSYITEVNLGILRLYGSLAFKNMYKRGLDMTPYNFGIRIKPTELLGKIEMR